MQSVSHYYYYYYTADNARQVISRIVKNPHMKEFTTVYVVFLLNLSPLLRLGITPKK